MKSFSDEVKSSEGSKAELMAVKKVAMLAMGVALLSLALVVVIALGITQ
jgi:hypothetical protein